MKGVTEFFNRTVMLGLCLFVVIVQMGMLFYFSWRYYNISVDGIPYQWRCLPRLETGPFGTDYIHVIFPEDTTAWLDDVPPAEGQTIYVTISRDAAGLMEIQGASASKPSQRNADYMEATAVAFDGSTVQFQVPFDRYRIAADKRDGIYDINASDSVIASIRIKRGKGVVEGVYVNGVPLESCSSGAAVEATRRGKQPAQSKGQQIRIVEPGMVPPQDES
ncbi:hypothetical protein [Megasphaera vaginalis (ex Srinivasan et al. 2021)]|uniref:GDYXXLXY protein n=1 Tax=Megasphaera vaginalis (ex Srinivasan et al. 2021) TaxID=1111454 RepID=U7UCC4_9FIRM|nr:hypothetical protein [Megasphaera vaginalis (ex Srinivasan et al. 2021)]ERT56504.1 hypothetical protein HMPREF1250_1582 [Megasphaera vaginalis (ex Srinivasan et al. 2021)]